jgi:hypothetical protein
MVDLGLLEAIRARPPAEASRCCSRMSKRDRRAHSPPADEAARGGNASIQCSTQFRKSLKGIPVLIDQLTVRAFLDVPDAASCRIARADAFASHLHHNFPVRQPHRPSTTPVLR